MSKSTSDNGGATQRPANSTPKLLVTGATGFIGQRLALHAHSLGIDVLASGRSEQKVELERLDELRAVNVPVKLGLLQDPAFVKDLMQGRDTVIHLAAAQHESDMPDAYFRAVNVDAARTLLEACQRAGIKRFVYGSTMGVYGAASDRLLDEDSPVRPENIYTRTKLEAEQLVRSYSTSFDTSIVRIAETYGPGDYRLLKLFRTIDRGHFFMIGAGTNRRQSIHVTDLVRGLLLAAQHPAAVDETFVFAGREIMTTNEMVRRIATAVDRKPPRLQLPMWPFVAAAGVMETTLPPLHIQPPLHSRRLDFFRKSFVFSTAKAHRLLGFQPTIDFQTGARDTAHWYRSHGHLSSRPSSALAGTESV